MERECILVVDDSPDVLRLLTGILKEAGYAVRPADSGALALASMQVQLADLVLLDVRMPDMDGHEVCRRLKGNPLTQGVPVIFLSGAAELEDRLEGFRLGAVDFVAKPFKKVELLARVRTHLELGRLRTRLEAEVKSRTVELNLACRDLEQALRLKDEFLAAMSHELRTPLAAVLGMSELLQDGTYGALNTGQAEAVSVIEQGGRRLLALVNDILDLAQLEAGQLSMENQCCPVEELVQAAWGAVRKSAGKKQITMENSLDEQAVMVWGDPRQLKRILVNLLDNAIKFTPVGGKVGVAVTVDAKNGRISFAVSDTGIGIAAGEIPRLFRPFVQIDGGLDRSHEGTGVGLALVRKLVQAHGGEVTVDSKPGAGSCFTVVLPWGNEHI